MTEDYTDDVFGCGNNPPESVRLDEAKRWMRLARAGGLREAIEAVQCRADAGDLSALVEFLQHRVDELENDS